MNRHRQLFLLHIAVITPCNALALATKHGFILPLQRIYIRNVSPFSLFVQVSSTQQRISGFYFYAISTSFLWYFPLSTGITMWYKIIQDLQLIWSITKIDHPLTDTVFYSQGYWLLDDVMTHQSMYVGHEWSLFTCLKSYMRNNVCHCVGGAHRPRPSYAQFWSLTLSAQQLKAMMP